MNTKLNEDIPNTRNKAGNSVSTEKYLQVNAEDIQWFREARFGLFINWGPCTLENAEISWSRCFSGRRQASSWDPSMDALGPVGDMPIEVSFVFRLYLSDYSNSLPEYYL